MYCCLALLAFTWHRCICVQLQRVVLQWRRRLFLRVSWQTLHSWRETLQMIKMLSSLFLKVLPPSTKQLPVVLEWGLSAPPGCCCPLWPWPGTAGWTSGTEVSPTCTLQWDSYSVWTSVSEVSKVFKFWTEVNTRILVWKHTSVKGVFIQLL